MPITRETQKSVKALPRPITGVIILCRSIQLAAPESDPSTTVQNRTPAKRGLMGERESRSGANSLRHRTLRGGKEPTKGDMLKRSPHRRTERKEYNNVGEPLGAKTCQRQRCPTGAIKLTVFGVPSRCRKIDLTVSLSTELAHRRMIAPRQRVPLPELQRVPGYPSIQTWVHGRHLLKWAEML
ncbi:hypothetical protein TYRP_023658 [Tyrophagus putrescentiae]|nr:hypothetical protein TYRP_023658 [Tyrophagus putrescentiae]